MERLYYFMKNYGDIGMFERNVMGYVPTALLNTIKDIINEPFEYHVYRDRDGNGGCFSYVEFNITTLIKNSNCDTSKWLKLFSSLR